MRSSRQTAAKLHKWLTQAEQFPLPGAVTYAESPRWGRGGPQMMDQLDLLGFLSEIEFGTQKPSQRIQRRSPGQTNP